MARQLSDAQQNSYTMTLYKGITYSREFQWKSADGTPVNLTGKILSIKFKDVFPSQLELFTNTGASILGSTFLITDAAEGKFRLQITHEETSSAGTGKGKWWIEFYSGADITPVWIDSVNVIEI